MNNIKVSKVSNSRLNELDFNKIPFGQVFSDHMFVADYIDGEWVNQEIKPVSEFSIHPGNMAWHYGQSIFEGMKATINQDGTPLLFRPEEHSVRLNASAYRMCMPEVPKQMFLDAIHTLVGLEKAWIPPAEGSALYIRPFMFALDHTIGVKPSKTYRFCILTLPVGPYYDKPVKLKATQNYIRAAKGGVGEAKTAGNYAASLYPAQLAKKEGFDQVMWLDAVNKEYIQEIGTMNIFFVIDGKVVTPIADGAILKGITRKSVIDVLKSEGIPVEERLLSIHEVFEAHENGKLTEIFGSGTAAVISNVSELAFKDKHIYLKEEDFKVSTMLKSFINKIRIGKIDDPFGWIVPVKVPVEA